MADMRNIINVGLLGYGVVGQGVFKNIEKNKEVLKKRLGVSFVIKYIAVKNLALERQVEVSPEILTDDPNLVINNKDIDVVCELIGGTDAALQFTEQALKNGKIVITANKALVCHHGQHLFDLAFRHGGHYLFEASVAGGIPIIKTINEALIANKFSLIYGIFNGTSNYILTRMEKEGLAFEQILKDARELGYVESDEALDLDGLDAAHKVIILTFLAHGIWVKIEDIICEGIRDISREDISFAKDAGYRIKLIGLISRDFSKNNLSVRLHPALIPCNESIAKVNDVYNGISVTGDVVGTTIYTGRGAGQDATSSSVISDIADSAALLQSNDISNFRLLKYKKNNGELDLDLIEQSKLEGRYYIRFNVKDEEGVLAKISKNFAKHHISFASVIQKELCSDNTLIMVTTHQTNEYSIMVACDEVNVFPAVIKKPSVIRIFNPKDYLE